MYNIALMKKSNTEKTHNTVSRDPNICVAYLINEPYNNQKSENATTPYYPISVLLSVKWLLMTGYKQEKISKF